MKNRRDRSTATTSAAALATGVAAAVVLSFRIVGVEAFAPSPPLPGIRRAVLPSPLSSSSAAAPLPPATRLCAVPSDDEFPPALAEEGVWSAYVDDVTTGDIYYFNGETGESRWDPPTSTFPAVGGAADKGKGKGKFLASIFGGGGDDGGSSSATATASSSAKKSTAAATTTKKAKFKLVENSALLSDIDAVLAEADLAIAEAERDLEKPPEKEEEEDWFASLGFGAGGTKKKEEADKKEAVAEVAAVEEEEPDWAEGIKNVFSAFGAPAAPPSSSPVENSNALAASSKKATAKKKGAAAVADSDRSGTEASKSRPTLSISEMMKAFQSDAGAKTKAKASAGATNRMPASVVTGEGGPLRNLNTLTLDSSLQIKPHPAKISWGGEDAGFVSPGGRTFGIFDGVTGAEKEGGKKLYSKSLADRANESAAGRAGSRNGFSRTADLTQILTDAKNAADAEATGASTAVLASVDSNNVLRALSVGDSALAVFRDGAVAARTKDIVHYFDCPYQFSVNSPDRPTDATMMTFELRSGDVVLAASDGVFDNVSEVELCDIVTTAAAAGAKAAVIAKKVADRSRTTSLDPDAPTPYARAAKGRKGYDSFKSGQGGKVDDIGIVIVKAS